MAEFSFSLGSLVRWGNFIVDGASAMVFEVSNDIAELREQGASDETIAESMRRAFAAGGGGYSQITARLNKAIDSIQRNAYSRAIDLRRNRILEDAAMESQFAGLDPGVDIDSLVYVWYAMGVNSCIDCVERHGQQRTMREWRLVGLPQSGVTICRHRCHCTLIMVERAQDMLRSKTPGELKQKMDSQKTEQIAYIKEIEKARGKDYAKSTFDGKVGKWTQRERAEREAKATAKRETQSKRNTKREDPRRTARRIAEIAELERDFRQRIG